MDVSCPAGKISTFFEDPNCPYLVSTVEFPLPRNFMYVNGRAMYEERTSAEEVETYSTFPNMRAVDVPRCFYVILRR